MTNKIILPTYVTTQPSTSKKVKFRPFTVKEEKSLLLALQEDSIEVVVEAIKNVVETCTFGAINASETPYYDMEYLYLQIRAKSVGEVIELIGSCECDPKNKTEFQVDISTMVVEPKPSGTISLKIPETSYTVTFTHPNIDDLSKTQNLADDHAEQVVANCIVSVCTEEEVMDWSPKEKLEFVESMTTLQQKDISKFLADMPRVKLPTKYTCKHCHKEHSDIISGFENFFV